MDRFGLAALDAPAGKLRRMIMAENVVKAYQARESYRDKDGNINWTEWANENPEANSLLIQAMKAATVDNGE